MENEIKEPSFLLEGNIVSMKSPIRHHGLPTLSLKLTR